tara:strand:+ start:150 stop:548 length:399 start_codon:yes stop_codon:yes gene_type:complete
MSVRERIRRKLQHCANAKYRISQKEIPIDTMKKQAFILVLEKMKEIEERRDFLTDELGIDMTGYEDKFFQVIEALLKLTFNKKQLELIQVYLFQLLPDKEWDGTIVLKNNDNTTSTVKFRTSEQVWNVIKTM